MRLTDISIRNLAHPSAGQKDYFCDTLTGFGIRCSQGSSQTFFVMFRKDGIRKRVTLGKVGVVKLADARAKAREILALNALHQHVPVSTRITYAEALETYLTAHLPAHTKPSTAQGYKWYLDRFLEPWRGLRLADITTHHITTLLDARETADDRAHTLRVLKTFFNFCVSRRYITQSPCTGLSYKVSKSRERVLKLPELRAVYEYAKKGAQRGNSFCAITLLLMLTLQRRKQFSHLQRRNLDFEAGMINWTAEDMKGNRPHSILMTDQVRQVLLVASRLQTGTYLFPARGKDKPISGWSKLLRLTHMATKTDGWTLHDLRRSGSTLLGEHGGKDGRGTPPHVIDALTAHLGVIGPVARIYNRYQYAHECLEAMNNLQKLLDAPIATSNHQLPSNG